MYKAKSININQIGNERFELVIPDENTPYIGEIEVTRDQLIALKNKLNKMYL